VARIETFRRNRVASQLIGWLLMALLPLQGMAACALGVRGPLHTHRAASQVLVLEDFRRAPTPAATRPVHIATAFGHFHAGATALRHFHRFADGSVVAVDDGGLAQAGDAGSSAADQTAGAPAGLLPATVAWTAPAVMQARAFHTAWPWLTFEPEPFERPPRSVGCA
jgi:hypothetical protein